MKTTSFFQKLSLVFFGVFLALLMLELALRLAGLGVLYLQKRHNHLTYQSNEYRILCLGESTTALGGEDSYPSQLQALLNLKSGGKRFTVINEGIISTTTEYILNHVDENLDKYKPKMVIVMMGINDKAYLHNDRKSLWQEEIKGYFQDFRVYKFIRLLCQHLSHLSKKITADTAPSNLTPDNGYRQNLEQFLGLVFAKSIQSYEKHKLNAAYYLKNKQVSSAQLEDSLADASLGQASAACVELARRYRFLGHFQDEQKILQEATMLNPGFFSVFQEWGEFYLSQGQSLNAVKAFQAALSLSANNSDVILGLAHAYHQTGDERAFSVYDKYLQLQGNDYWGYIELAKWLMAAKHDELAQVYLSRALAYGPDFDRAYVLMGQSLDEQGRYREEEGFYLKEISLHPKLASLYQELGRFYQKHGPDALARKYFKEAAQRGMEEFSPVTLVNYSLLLNKILKRHIKVIVMQYPVRGIDILKDYLGIHSGVLYVENRKNFKMALSRADFWHYFKDNFAYDFGHCTRAGNELIAKNLAGVIPGFAVSND